MAGIIPIDDLRRLQKSMNRLMEDLGLSNWESKYLGEMQRIQKRLNEVMGEMELPKMEGNIMMPMADVKETDDAIIVAMDLPGVNKEDVDISITDSELRVVAEKSVESEISDKDYHKRERIYNKFERAVVVPVAVKADLAKARLENGVLEVTLPKEVTTTRKKIKID